MSVDFSSTVAYGIAYESTEDIDFFSNLENVYEDGEIPELLNTWGCDLIGYDNCGNWMNSPQVYLFYVKGTEILDHDIYDMETIIEFSNDDVSDDALAQLAYVMFEVGVEAPVGWKLISNVS